MLCGDRILDLCHERAGQQAAREKHLCSYYKGRAGRVVSGAEERGRVIESEEECGTRGVGGDIGLVWSLSGDEVRGRRRRASPLKEEGDTRTRLFHTHTHTHAHTHTHTNKQLSYTHTLTHKQTAVLHTRYHTNKQTALLHTR